MTEIYHADYNIAMRGFKIPLLVTLIISLGLGVGLGLKLRRDRAARLGVVTSSRNLRVLSLTGTFPPTLAKGFRSSENIEVSVTEAATPDAVLNALNSTANFDLVTLRSSQILKALQDQKIQTVNVNGIAGFDFVSRDFVDLPGHLPGVVPILWGVEKVNGTESSLDGGTLWILSLALTARAAHEPEANAFLAYILKPEVAFEISMANHEASANLGVESTALDSRLKPLYLRQIPLTQFKLEKSGPIIDAVKPSNRE